MWEEVYKVVKKIPKGKVMTYGQIAKELEIKDVRKVGWALHANKSSDVPCHRVVNKEGRLAKNFAFDGEVEQQRRLESEGIVFTKNLYVDLAKYGM
jgi:methylated-DNA-protein-cysteine methyltransferase-like protein